MKVLLATDGSATSSVAVALVAGLQWPEGTTVRIITTLDTVRLAGPWATMTSYGLSDLESELLDELEAVVGDAATAIEPSGVTVERQILLGRPSAAIVDHANAFGADLIVMGSRGHGPLRTMLLGSVSAEVVDHAPCPVLVARSPQVRRILIAHDGSYLARAAEDLVAGMTPLATQPVEIVSVVRTHQPSADTIAPAAMGRAVDQDRTAVAESHRHHEDLARDAAERLARLGREVTWAIRSGDPAHALIEEAEARGVDLVAMGTHGRTGLDRIVMGSVARKVLIHAHCSVLIVRAGTRVADSVAHAGDAPVESDAPHA
jgi:nucleotide-binding universal stress UspA family protein